MSAFGNLFSQESSTSTTIQNYSDSFNVADSNNISTANSSTLSGVLNTSVTLGGAADLPKVLPWIFGGAAFVFLFWMFRR